MESFLDYNELASDCNGGSIIFATDDYFAPAEMMIQESEPVFIADKFTEFGKWMDGWETRRKRIPGHDWCIIQLAAPCKVEGFLVDTAFFTGNYTPKISIQGKCLTENEISVLPKRNCQMGTCCSEDDVKIISELKSNNWNELVPVTSLKPGYPETKHNYISVNTKEIVSHIRINMYPDGGIARLRVYGNVEPDLNKFVNNNIEDLILLNNGGQCIKYSNAHFGHPRNLIKSKRGINMGDGWETARRLDRPSILECDNNGILKVPGNEWAIFKLCCPGNIEKIIVDTNHFKGNFPDSVRIQGIYIKGGSSDLAEEKWDSVLTFKKLSAHKEHEYSYDELENKGPFNYIKVIMAPDGGISRLRILGTMYEEI